MKVKLNYPYFRSKALHNLSNILYRLFYKFISYQNHWITLCYYSYSECPTQGLSK